MDQGSPRPPAAHDGLGRAARCALPLAAIALVTTWPWTYQDHAHWQAVEWVPFTRYVRPWDWLANVGLFVPLGAAYAWGGPARRVREAVWLGLACSLAAELGQVFMHGRAPTVSDVVANTLGVWLGSRWGAARATPLSVSAARSSPALPRRAPSGPP
jgi:VanZ family protein